MNTNAFDIVEFQRNMEEIEAKEYCRCNQLNRGFITAERSLEIYSRHQNERAELMRKLSESNQSWRICGTTILFQHPINNYDADDEGKRVFPNAIWDSENGQGFCYCNAKDASTIMAWLEGQLGCTRISSSNNSSLADCLYISNIKIKPPETRIFSRFDAIREINLTLSNMNNDDTIGRILSMLKSGTDRIRVGGARYSYVNGMPV